MRYTPHYLLTDEDEVKRLIRENPWATIVSNTAKGLVASHYPVVLEEDQPGISIVSHVGRPDERILITVLEAADGSEADMATCIIVGTSETRHLARPNSTPLVYTPRSVGAFNT